MRRILVVDDNEDILEVIKLILEDYGYEVVTLAEGTFLFEEIKTHRPDLILLDIMLGDMDGRELCRAVKSTKETQDIPIVLVSASHNLPDRFMPGVSHIDFLAKPFDISELLDKVQTNLSAA
ncbi:MAG: response regulator [Mucilaginibacter sp.]